MFYKKIFCFFIFNIVFLFPVFCGPFGLDMGMTLAQIKQKTGKEPIHIEDDIYEVTPPNTHNLFESYVVWVNPTYGIYYIKAIGKDILTNGYGNEVKSTFDNLVLSIEKIYGKYKKNDFLQPSKSYRSDPQYFMPALRDGDRELMAFWNKKEGAKLSNDILEIIVSAHALSSSEGYVTIEYSFVNQVKVDEEQNSVF